MICVNLISLQSRSYNPSSVFTSNRDRQQRMQKKKKNESWVSISFPLTLCTVNEARAQILLSLLAPVLHELRMLALVHLDSWVGSESADDICDILFACVTLYLHFFRRRNFPNSCVNAFLYLGILQA